MADEIRSSSLQAGQVLVGKYRVERLIGQGGMGVVLEATHLQLEERVAMKFLLPEYARHPEASARFLREARAAVKIRSEHVARVMDVGTLEDGTPYMVMECLTGGDLSALLKAHGPLPIVDAVDYVLQACEALAEAHKAGIVHRDLKPANLFVTQRSDRTPLVKLLDFGISKVKTPGSDFSMTKTSSLMGSPLYMSPEQMQSARNADVASDIWALGVILYELLAGRPPFNGDTLPELICSVVQEPAASLRSLRPDVPPELDAAILRCLEKNPAARYPNVAWLAQALAPFASHRGQVSVERASVVLEIGGDQNAPLQAAPGRASHPSLAGTGSAAAISTPGATHSGWGQTAAPRRGSRVPLVIAGAMALLLLAAIGIFAVVRLSRSVASAAPDESASVVLAGQPSAAATASESPPPVVPTVPEPVEEPTPPASASVAPSAAVVPPPNPVAQKPAATKPPKPKAAGTQAKPDTADTAGFGDRR
jgi:eukaryotic-like serine/threonine-protein kinase